MSDRIDYLGTIGDLDMFDNIHGRKSKIVEPTDEDKKMDCTKRRIPESRDVPIHDTIRLDKPCTELMDAPIHDTIRLDNPYCQGDLANMVVDGGLARGSQYNDDGPDSLNDDRIIDEPLVDTISSEFDDYDLNH